MQGKRVLLGVTGGIAAYKSPDLVRRLREQGAEVQVVLTSGAREFVTPMTFQAVSGREVRSDLWDPEAEKAMSHIELARWADFVIIAPATADFIARLATGQADDLLTTLCLATDRPIALAPAMNRLMWANPATQANVVTLKSRGIHVWGPRRGRPGLRRSGRRPHARAAPARRFVASTLVPSGPLAGKRVLLTAGPTRERIDPVRFHQQSQLGKDGLRGGGRGARARRRCHRGRGPLQCPARRRPG
jgi:phosphopantothenoylcysteine decarboxylase/phosphopantothenate--cysteine ligase